MPDPTPLEEARAALFDRIGEFIEDGPWLSQSVGVPPKVDALIAEAKAEAVEPIAQALLEPDAITCDADGVVLSDGLVRAIEGLAEARRALSEGADDA